MQLVGGDHVVDVEDRDIFHYTPLHFNSDEDFENVVPSLQMHLDEDGAEDEQFDLILLDHEPPARFLC